ncbi:DUF2917 domain-containing protein [Variovorax rhizosphaerae]|uniref:DUF2917 domain-containing protein n=1 Tax=Variovorax rhizosphaerae TaxID=1836200 RepID=A0ABU8WM09_9BURK
MTANFDQAFVELDRDLFVRIVDAVGSSVTCISGCLWITRDGSLKDVELEPGERYLVEDAARVIVTGFGPSLARLSHPQVQHRPARPLGSLLRGWRRRLEVV